MASTETEPWYAALLGLSERFRTSNPPNIKLCIHCLQSIFTFKPNSMIQSRTHLQLGAILMRHTKNQDQARGHLEQAWRLSKPLDAYDDVKFETACTLAQLYTRMEKLQDAKQLLQNAIEISQQAPHWHCRMLFQVAQIYASEKDYRSACNFLGLGADYSAVKKAEYTRILFMLSKGMLLLIGKNLEDVRTVLSQAGSCIENWSASSQASKKESLKVFFLVLQVCHLLVAGQVKSVKAQLKQLQQSIQTISSLHSDDGLFVTEPVQQVCNPADQFQWLPKEHMCVLVYLVTVMHSMQAGYMDKAQKYTDKALMQIEKLKMVDAHPLLNQFQLMLLEHIIMCRLIMGNKTLAIQEILQACQVVHQQPKLFLSHTAQIHTLLGLYAMSMNCMEAAEAQFRTALLHTSEKQLWAFVKLNLGIVYLRMNRYTDLSTLLDDLNPESMEQCSQSLRASAFYVKGLQSFFQAKYNEAKRYLRETLKMANAEDLNRLTSCSLVLLGHIFLSLGNSQEALNMVKPAMQLAAKIPDVHVQLWASALLKDLYHLCGNQAGEAEGFRMHDSFSQLLLKDHFQSSQLPEHKLIQWTDGPVPIDFASTLL